MEHTLRGRIRRLALFVLVWPAACAALMAQAPAVDPSVPDGNLHGLMTRPVADPMASGSTGALDAGGQSSDTSDDPLQMARPADVLTPNQRRNTPYLKIAARVGGNYAAFSNDRYLDNTPLDVGRTSGETAIYTSAGAFGYGGGVELEYPLNTGLSVLGTVDYQRARFGSEGPVQQACIDSGGGERAVNASHEFLVDLHYLRLGAAFKIAFPSFYMVGGLTAAPLLHSTVYRERRIVDGGAACLLPGFPPRREIIEEDELPDPSGLHYSFRIGVGRSYQIGERFQFSPELMIDFGLNQINKSPESDLDIYSFNAVLRYELR